MTIQFKLNSIKLKKGVDLCLKEYYNLFNPTNNNIKVKNMNKEQMNNTKAPLEAFKVTKAINLVAKSPNYIIKGLLEDNKNTAIYGDSMAGKTFLTLSAMYAVALATLYPNMEWNGMPVAKASPVLYCCGEGQEGIDNRLIGIRNSYNLPNQDNVPFYKTDRSVILNNELNVEQIILTAKQIKEAEGEFPNPIVFDTLNTSFSGNENSADDIAALIRGMNEIRYATGSCVIVVHHEGKNGEIRGSSALRAGVDKLIRVSKQDKENSENNNIVVSDGKSKDSKESDDLILRKEIVKIGFDERWQEDITTLILKKVSTVDEKSKEKEKVFAKVRPHLKGKMQEQVFDVIAELSLENKVMPMQEVLQLAVERTGKSQKQIKSILDVFNNHKKIIQMSDENLVIVSEEEILNVI